MNRVCWVSRFSSWFFGVSSSSLKLVLVFFVTFRVGFFFLELGLSFGNFIFVGFSFLVVLDFLLVFSLGTCIVGHLLAYNVLDGYKLNEGEGPI